MGWWINISKIETGYPFTIDMSDEIIENFFSGNFNQDSAILKLKNYSRPDIIFQHLPFKERVRKIRVSRMRNGYIIDSLISVDITEVIRTGGKLNEIFEEFIQKENFRVNPFKRVIGKLFEYEKYYKEQCDKVMELLVNLSMDSLYGEQIRRDIEEEYVSKSENWMLTEYDERVKDYWCIGTGKYIVKLGQDKGKEDDNDKVNVMPLHLGAFVLSNS